MGGRARSDANLELNPQSHRARGQVELINPSPSAAPLPPGCNFCNVRIGSGVLNIVAPHCAGRGIPLTSDELSMGSIEGNRPGWIEHEKWTSPTDALGNNQHPCRDHSSRAVSDGSISEGRGPIRSEP